MDGSSTSADADPGLGQPWPDGDDHVVFVLDATNATERDLLHRWVEANRPAVDRSHEVVVADAAQARALRPAGWVLDPRRAATVVPARVAWSPGHLERSGPRVRDLVLGDPHNPNGAAARYYARRHPHRARTTTAPAAAVADLAERYERSHPSGDDRRAEDFTAYVLRTAGIALDVHERRFEGRRYKVPRGVVAACEHRPSFKRAVRELAEEQGRSPTAVAAECRTYLEEMAATPSPFFIDWTGKLTRWIVSLGYREIVVDPATVERVGELVRDHPTAFLFTHKSHVDGMALISVLYEHDVTAPHQLGGINMAFRGLATLSRRGGTIFIRRSFGDNRPYKLALQQYLGYLMEKRFPFSWAFEGTRSRTGKLVAPRYGILKYVTEAARAARTGDLHLVPVAINYDLIGEVDEYGRQEAGLPKRPEDMRWFLGYLRELRAPMGRLYLDFAEPIVFDGSSDDDVELSDIAVEVARRVNALVPVTLPALLCTVLLGHAPRALTVGELDTELRALIAWLKAREVRMAGSFDEADAPQLETLATITFERGLIERFDRGPTTVFSVRDDQYPMASYYRNTVVHYFVDKAIAEVALLSVVEEGPSERTDAFWRRAHELRDLLQFEFFLSPPAAFGAAVEAELEAADRDWRSALRGAPGEARVLVGGLAPVVAPATLLSFVEAYWLVAHLLAELPATETLTGEDAIARALGAGEQFVRQGRISTRASLGKQMFRGAYQLLKHRGVVEPGPAAAERRGDLAAELRRFADTVIALRPPPPSG